MEQQSNLRGNFDKTRLQEGSILSFSYIKYVSGFVFLPRVLIMEDVEKLTELSNCADTVHRHPVNAYQHFVNAFTYVKNSYGRQDAVRKAQKLWKAESDKKKDFILKEAFRKLEMTKKKNHIVFLDGSQRYSVVSCIW